jgi:hypothetical protein
MFGQHPDRRKVQGTLAEHFEDDGEAPGGTRRLDAITGFLFGEAKDLRAVGEKGAKARAQIEPSRVELHEMADQGHCGLARAAGQAPHLGGELDV